MSPAQHPPARPKAAPTHSLGPGRAPELPCWGDRAPQPEARPTPTSTPSPPTAPARGPICPFLYQNKTCVQDGEVERIPLVQEKLPRTQWWRTREEVGPQAEGGKGVPPPPPPAGAWHALLGPQPPCARPQNEAAFPHVSENGHGELGEGGHLTENLRLQNSTYNVLRFPFNGFNLEKNTNSTPKKLLLSHHPWRLGTERSEALIFPFPPSLP